MFKIKEISSHNILYLIVLPSRYGLGSYFFFKRQNKIKRVRGQTKSYRSDCFDSCFFIESEEYKLLDYNDDFSQESKYVISVIDSDPQLKKIIKKYIKYLQVY